MLKAGAAVWNNWRKTVPNNEIDLNGADLSDVQLSVINLSRLNLVGTNFERAKIFKTLFSGSNLNKSNFSHVSMDGGYFAKCSLEEADFTSCLTQDAQFHFAKLNGAIFTKAKLANAKFCHAELSTTNFSYSDLREADFYGSMLIRTDFTGADLSRASITYSTFSKAELHSTNFDGTITARAVYSEVDLSNALNLARVNHKGPSTIGIDTLYQSKGQIPEVFLRGCGVPDSFITQAKALAGAEDGIQFYSCFISYSTKDDEFARRLHARLQQEHVRVWFAPHDMQSGKKVHEQIDEAIKIYDKLLILLSPNSLQSEWVMTELRKARKAERKIGRRKLFPIGLVDYTTLQEWECFDADGGQDLAVEVRQYFIPDLTNWKDHDAFEAAFARLLKDLRASERSAGGR